MEVASRYTLFTSLTLFVNTVKMVDTLDMVYTVDMVQTVDMNTLFYFDCLGHQQLKMLPYAVTRMGVTGLDGWMGHTPWTVMTTRAPAVLKTVYFWTALITFCFLNSVT